MPGISGHSHREEKGGAHLGQMRLLRTEIFQLVGPDEAGDHIWDSLRPRFNETPKLITAEKGHTGATFCVRHLWWLVSVRFGRQLSVMERG